jgi:hypothetical protein
MSLYLCIFNDDEELGGVDVGAYSDFGDFRKTIAETLEDGKAGSRFPALMTHADSDGEWSIDECETLENEFKLISEELKQRPPKEFFAEWQKGIAKSLSLHPKTLYECFIDVDGEPLLERLLDLVLLAKHHGLPILFQ